MPPAPVPREPPPTRWNLAQGVREAGESDLVAVGADLEPGTLVAAYRCGVFPMGLTDPPVMGWWSPVSRGVLRPGELHISRSLRRTSRRYRITVDHDFAGVLDGCARPGRDGDWITPEIEAAYTRLHDLGWAHSIEVRDPDGDLVGGLYGVAVGRLFAGESMFRRATDASKTALIGLTDVLADGRGDYLIDVQWQTGHLASLGIGEIDRADYLARLPGLVSALGWDWAAAAGEAPWVPGEPSIRTR